MHNSDTTSIFAGAFGLVVIGLLFMLAIASILAPFVLWSCMNTLHRMEKLHRKVAKDIVDRLNIIGNIE